MPVKRDLWKCRLCDAVFDNEGYANNCETAHAQKIEIKGLAVHPFSGHKYEKETKFPTLLEVTDGIDTVQYLLLDSKKARAGLKNSVRVLPNDRQELEA
jgi:hypothetical protein